MRRCACCLAWLAVALACSDTTPPNNATNDRLWVRATGLVTAVGDTVRLGATWADSTVTTYHEYPGSVSDPWPTDIHLRWRTSDFSIASIDTASVVTAHKLGRVAVWVALGSVEDSGTIVVGSGSGGTAMPYVIIAPGLDHTCALDVRGAAYCWGSDFSGALGRGRIRQFTRAALPGRVSGGHLFTALAVGGDHACGLTTAGAVLCWGGNQYGQLGDGTDGDAFSEIGGFGRSVPVPVLGGRVFMLVAAGGFHTCAIDAAGGAFCWGWHALGQLGIGPVQSIVDQVAPTAVADGHTFRTLGLGPLHSCGITTDSVTYCWGMNDRAQLGIDTTATPRVCAGSSRCSGTPVQLDTAYRFTTIAASRTQTCALTADGTTYCWGNGSPIPTSVGGPPLVSLVAGALHTCGLTAAGAAYCWGSNRDGQLGTGTVGGSEPSPVAVNTTVTFVVLGAGAAHTCGIDGGGQAYCWGRSANGQVGNGTVQAPNAVFTATVPVPVRILNPLP